MLLFAVAIDARALHQSAQDRRARLRVGIAGPLAECREDLAQIRRFSCAPCSLSARVAHTCHPTLNPPPLLLELVYLRAEDCFGRSQPSDIGVQSPR
ncbi:MAG: hypothetical protein M3O99_09760, partial [Chloroflexota bacterium]|nr:hypothetical protein [Chloroflexota bacterium]